MIQRFAPSIVALVLVCLLQPAGLRGEQAPSEDTTVLEVSVRGNRRMSDTAILGNVRTRAGAPFSEDVAKADQRRLMETGRFDNVVVVKAPTAEGLLVTFVVTERPRISAVRVRGVKSIPKKKVREQIDFGADDPLAPARVELARMGVEELYRSEGFYFVNVTVDEQLLRERRQVVFTVVEGPQVRVRSIEFEFEDSESFPHRKLRRQIKTKKAFWIITRGRLDADQLAQDVFSLRTFYREEGYLDAEVARELSFSPDRSEADVRFIIDEGPRYRVGETRFGGNVVFADEELADLLKLQPGRHFTMLEMRRDTQAVEDAYGQIGYVDVGVSPTTLYMAPGAAAPADVEVDEDDPAFLIVSYDIAEGDPYYLGRVTIRGNEITKDRVIRRQMTMYPGQTFNTVAMRRSEQKLQESRLFTDVAVTPYGDDAEFRNVLVDIEEGKTAELTFGAGYSTNSGVIGNFSFMQRNFSWTQWPTDLGDLFAGRGFKGDGQSLRLHIEPGTEVLRASIDWREPYLFDRPITLGVGGYTFTRQRRTYDEARTGAHVSLGKLFKNRWYGELAARVEGVRIDGLTFDAPSEVEADAGDHTAVSFQGTLVRDRTDSRWQPSTGGRISLRTQQFTGDYVFTQYGAEYARYWTTYLDALDRKHILAGRVSADFITGDSPIYERYYGGGIGGIRGFEYRGISPRTQDPGLNDPIGGEFKAYAGLEYSFPLVARNLRGVLFLDTGTVEQDVDVSTWRAAVGAGIRLTLPMMGPIPLSLDFGVPIKEDPEDDNQLISFSIGWTF